MRAGRKRKIVAAREPNGRASRSEAGESMSPVLVRRIVDQARAGAMDARLGSVVGRLLLAGQLSARQAGAAWRFGELVADYQKAVGSPVVRPLIYERGARAAAPDLGSAAGELVAARERRAVRRYERALSVLDSLGASVSVSRLVRDALPGYAELIAARRGLDALAVHFSA